MTAVHRGDYADLGRTHGAVGDYISAHRLIRVGPSWEIYGHWREDPSELRPRSTTSSKDRPLFFARPPHLYRVCTSRSQFVNAAGRRPA